MTQHFRSAIVTGGASGIGKATVKMLAGDGVKVYCADINEHAGCCVVEDARRLDDLNIIRAAGGEPRRMLSSGARCGR